MGCEQHPAKTIPPKLETVEGKHATRCLVAVHYQLWQKLFAKFRDSQANIANMFGVERKKFYTSITGHTYDAGKKLTKAEKKEPEAHDLDLKKQKLMKQGTKPEKQETKSDDKEPQEENPQDKSMGDSDDMPMLISDEDTPKPMKPMKFKHFQPQKDMKFRPSSIFWVVGP